VGKIVTQLHPDVPVLIALLNDENKGLYVDSLLTDIGSISIILAFLDPIFL